jgi:hypothetical protein
MAVRPAPRTRRYPTASPGSWWRGLLICAIDGTTLTVPDNPRILARFTKQTGNHGGTGDPQIRLVTLLACGTRTLIDAVFGPTSIGETIYTPRLLRSLRTGMILLADRNFGAKDLLAQIAATRADLLVHLKNGRTMPVLARYPTAPTSRPQVRYGYASSSARSPSPPAPNARPACHHPAQPTLLQAAEVTYQLLRTAMADATNTRPDLDPDRASFSIAWQSARTSSSTPPTSSPTRSSTWSARSADTSWPRCWPPAGYASALASSNAPSPNTRSEDRTSTGPATRPLSLSTS